MPEKPKAESPSTATTSRSGRVAAAPTAQPKPTPMVPHVPASIRSRPSSTGSRITLHHDIFAITIKVRGNQYYQSRTNAFCTLLHQPQASLLRNRLQPPPPLPAATCTMVWQKQSDVNRLKQDLPGCRGARGTSQRLSCEISFSGFSVSDLLCKSTRVLAEKHCQDTADVQVPCCTRLMLHCKGRENENDSGNVANGCNQALLPMWAAGWAVCQMIQGTADVATHSKARLYLLQCCLHVHQTPHIMKWWCATAGCTSDHLMQKIQSLRHVYLRCSSRGSLLRAAQAAGRQQ